MGYHTDFDGSFQVEPPLKPEHRAYLEKFSGTRRMRRVPAITAARPDPIREAAGLPVGRDGAYFVGAGGHAGQEPEEGPLGANRKKLGIIDYNSPPAGQPGLWCQWTPTEDGEAIVWDGGEKFYDYVEWLQYLIAHFLKPWGYVLNGKVEWEGEERSDFGVICVEANEVSIRSGRRELGPKRKVS